MSLAIARDSPERLLPVLSTLTNYQAYYKEVTEYLENMARLKIKSLGQIKCQMELFIDESQNLMEKMITSIDKEVTNILNDQQNSQRDQSSSEANEGQLEVESYQKMRQSTLSIRDNRSIGKRSTRPKLKNKNNNKYERKYERKQNTKKSHQLTQKEREQLYHQIITKQRKRCYSQEKAAKQKMKRNTKISQAHIRHFLTHFLDSQKSVHSIKMQKNFYIHVCTMCDMMIYTSKFKSNIVKHYLKFHQVKINQDQPTIIMAEQLYKIYKKRIDTENLVYYRCNCMVDLFSSKEEYLLHIKQSHNNNIPPFSSHIFSEGQEVMMEQPQLIVNPQYNQYCILEDVILGEIFYCGKCQISFRYSAQLYYDHLVNFHKAVDDHPANSHILRKQLIPSLKKPHQNRRGITIQKFVNDHKIKYQRNTRKYERQGKQNKIEYRQKKERYIYKQYFDEPELQFPEQKIFLQTIRKYNGPFICTHCHHDFGNFAKIREHFEDKNIIEQLANRFCQQYFLRITVTRNKSVRYRYYIPRKFKNDDDVYNQVLKIPFKGSFGYEIKKYKNMSLRELIEFVETRSHKNCLNYRGTPSSAFFWILQ